MLYSFLKTSLRSLFKTKLSSFINVAGLSIGLASFLFICLYVIEEFKYDRHYENVDRLFRITSYFNGGEDETATIETPSDLSNDLFNQFAEIEAATRMLKTDKGFLFAGDAAFQENIIFTDSSFIKVFGFEILEGSERSCLVKPRSIIISESKAVRIYGRDWRTRRIIGETLSIDGKFDYTLSAVFKDFPVESHFHSNLFATDSPDLFSSTRKVYTYVLLKENASHRLLDSKISKAFTNRDWFIRGNYSAFGLQAVADIHLYSEFDEENNSHGTIGSVYTFSLIAFFLLIICSVNFINLYLANINSRLKEVSVRKVMGGSKRQLFLQFLLEPILITALSMVVAVMLVYTLLPYFNQVLNKTLSLSSISSWYGVSLLVVMTLVIGLLTGIYPAASVAFKETGVVLKDKSRWRGTWFQNGLVVGQFVLSAAIIVLTVVAFQQVQLIQKKDVGYDKDNVLLLQNVNMLGGLPEMLSFKNELLRINGVEEASISGYTPAQNLWGRLRSTFPGKDHLSAESLPATWLMVDDQFLPTLSIELSQGRNFSETPEFEKRNVLINETAARQFQLQGDGGPLNKEISFVDEGTNEVTSYKIVGVVKDFNFGSLHEPIKPIVMTFGFHRYEMIVRLNAERSRDVIAEITRLWKLFLPRVAVSYNFLRDRYNRSHEADISAGKLFSVFSILNIVVACLGLFGLVSYTTTQRTKEIGIRKVLGASTWLIIALMSEKYLKLVALAFLLSLPLAWTLARKWLEVFAYKVQISGWVFLFTGAFLFSVTFVTVVYVSARAARANPVRSLSYE